MKSPFWPRTIRDWIALQLARLAAAVAESRRLYDANLRIALDTDWQQPVTGSCEARSEFDGYTCAEVIETLEARRHEHERDINRLQSGHSQGAEAKS